MAAANILQSKFKFEQGPIHRKTRMNSKMLLSLCSVLVLTYAGVTLIPRAYRNEHHAAKRDAGAVPLILQEDNGDRLVHRAGPLKGVPFTIKIDGQFGNSEDFFVFTEGLAPGQTIPFHKHENAEEVLIFEEAGATVTVGDKRGVAGAHSLVFIPRDTWISATNTSAKEIAVVAVFSRHGFEQYMRSISAKPGEPLTPLSPEELQRLRTLGHAVYWDSARGVYPPGVAHN
jgi:mannose-6-phosphate isomerase-like protein (cupin superfamily)